MARGLGRRMQLCVCTEEDSKDRHTHMYIMYIMHTCTHTHTHTHTLTHSFHYSTVELEVQATQTNYQHSRLHPLLFRDGIEDFVQDEGRTPSTTASFFDIRIRLAVQVHEIFKVNLHNTIGTIKHLINIRDNYAVTCWYATCTMTTITLFVLTLRFPSMLAIHPSPSCVTGLTSIGFSPEC